MSPRTLDPDIHARVTKLLFDLLPSIYRVRDAEPVGPVGGGSDGRGHLERFLEVLALPLAEVRQSVEELHADLFIDTAADWVIPYLAQMVGTHVVFPDADSNRRDVRGTVRWRKRKGTPATLEELGTELLGRTVVTQEGWKRLLMSQDLNLLRPNREVLDLRRFVVAEKLRGPLDDVAHVLDARPLARNEGGHHPKALGHWLHPTALFPLRGATPFDRTLAVAPKDLRFAFHAEGRMFPLRARRAGEGTDYRTDRIPPLHFAEDPGRWFGREGGFTVRIAGLPAAVPMASAPQGAAHGHTHLRRPSSRAAHRELVAAAGAVEVVHFKTDRFTGPIRIELFAVPFCGSNVPDLASASLRARRVLHRSGPGATAAGAASVPSPHVAMLRLSPVSGPAEFFPGAIVHLHSEANGARLASTDPELAREGFLRGALHVELPAGWVRNARWFFVAADGSLFDAAPSGTQLPVTLAAGSAEVTLPGVAVTTGPGAAYPPIGVTASDTRCTAIPPAWGHGPAFMHGGGTLRETGPETFQPVSSGAMTAIAFAARHLGNVPMYEPIGRFAWTGADPATGTWTVLGADGASATDPAGRHRALARLLEGARALQLVARLEADAADRILPPCEVSWPVSDGRALLLHLPQLSTGASPPAVAASAWPKGLAFAGAGVAFFDDGSAERDGVAMRLRASLGQVAPLLRHAALRRRQVRGRTLCPWDNETPGNEHAPVGPGLLDVDVEHALFALASGEGPQPWSSSAHSTPPPSVTVDFEEGATLHVGALPAPREPVLRALQKRPTRIVSRMGVHASGAPLSHWELPRYPTLTAALAAIAGDPAEDEIIELQDSATYPDEAPAWPAGVRHLTIQSAERERPWVQLNGWTSAAGASFESITLRGIILGGAEVTFAPAERVQLELCTVKGERDTLRFTAPASGEVAVRILRSVTAGLLLMGRGRIEIEDGIVACASGDIAVQTATAQVELDRVTVVGDVRAFALEASDCLFTGDVTVEDRFQGCVRYSRVPRSALLPRLHRITHEVPRFVSTVRLDPAWLRLAEDCPRAIVRGAESSSEMGAFHEARAAQRDEALVRRLEDFTPAGMTTGLVRLD